MSKRYRTAKVTADVLREVDLEVDRGEFVTLVGPSGSGKSTLLHAVGGLDTDYDGDIVVDGTRLRDLSDDALSRYRNRDVGFVFQSFFLLPHLTCEENVALPALFQDTGAPREDQDPRIRAREILEQVNLADKIGERPPSLSGGQKQRVAIARALFNRPKLMLADEPTGNLDTAMGATILDIFRRINRDHGLTIIVVTHDPNIARNADRCVRVQDGSLTEVTMTPESSI